VIALFDALAVEHPYFAGRFSDHVIALFDALAVEHPYFAGRFSDHVMGFVRCASSRTSLLCTSQVFVINNQFDRLVGMM